jgi:hypothetical protein
MRAVPAIVFQRDARKEIIGLSIDSDPLRDAIFKKE